MKQALRGPADPERDSFAEFVSAYQEALAGGQPLPEPVALDPQQRQRWQGLRHLIHRLHECAFLPSAIPPPAFPPGQVHD